MAPHTSAKGRMIVQQRIVCIMHRLNSVPGLAQANAPARAATTESPPAAFPFLRAKPANDATKPTMPAAKIAREAVKHALVEPSSCMQGPANVSTPATSSNAATQATASRGFFFTFSTVAPPYLACDRASFVASMNWSYRYVAPDTASTPSGEPDSISAAV